MPTIRNKSKSWLITSETELIRDSLQRDQYIRSYLEKSPFPGIRSSVLDKIKWLKAIETEYDDILEDSCYMTMAPEAEEAVKDILLKTAPDEIRVDFILSKKQLDDIAGAMSHNNKTKFVKNFRKYHDITNKSENDDALAGSLDTFEKCKLWIDQTNQVPSKSDPNRGDVLLASVKAKKDTALTKILFPTMNDLGIGDYVCGAEPGEHEMNHYKWSVQEKIGENMYSGIHDVDSGNDNDGVHWSMHLKTHGKEDESEAERAFRKLLKDQTNASKERGNPKINMLIDREDLPKNDDCNDDEDSPQTPAFVQPLWLPDAFEKHYSRIAPHLSWGEGESAQIQQRLRKGNTDTGNIKVDLIKYELQYAKKIPSVKERFCAILALSLAASNDYCWMHDNECSDEVEKLVKGLATLFRNYLKEADAVLGIGLEDGSEVSDENGLTSSRALLYQFMKGIAKKFKDVCKFLWKPPPQKKKTQDQGMQPAHPLPGPLDQVLPNAPSLEDYIEEKMNTDDGDGGWVPRNKQGKQKSCNVIRTEITRFLSSGEMNQTSFLGEIGCNSNSYGRFMKLKGAWNGTQNGVYWGSARFFERKQLADAWEKKYNPATAKRKIESAAAEKKSSKLKLNDVASKTNTIDYTEGPIYDSCPEIRRKITAFLKSSGTTGTAFCRLVGVPSNSLTRFMKHKPVPGTINSAESMRSSQPGAAMNIYPSAYHFFERFRLAEGKTKTKKRVENEGILSVPSGICSKYGLSSQPGFVCKHDDGRRIVFKGRGW